MQVLEAEPGWARVQGRGETRRVKTSLVGACAPGQWLLVFLDDAREIIGQERAAEVNATLDLVFAALASEPLPSPGDDPGFALPSAMRLHDVQRLTQG